MIRVLPSLFRGHDWDCIAQVAAACGRFFPTPLLVGIHESLDGYQRRRIRLHCGCQHQRPLFQPSGGKCNRSCSLWRERLASGLTAFFFASPCSPSACLCRARHGRQAAAHPKNLAAAKGEQGRIPNFTKMPKCISCVMREWHSAAGIGPAFLWTCGQCRLCGLAYR